jgi:hypothetical protein
VKVTPSDLERLRARPEREIQKEILAYLQTVRSVVAWKNGTGSFRAVYNGEERFVRIGKKGIADVLGIVAPRGRLLALEVKSLDGRMTPEQADFIMTVKRMGGIGGCVRSVQDVVQLLEIEGVRQ